MASMNEKDYYKILEVDEKATTDEIRRAFQKKARKLHPDVNKEPDAEERFKEVSEAYAVLSDTEKRNRYDAMRSGMPFGGAGYPGGSATGYGGADSPFGSGFPFGGAWTRRQTTPRSYRPRSGEDVVYQLDLDAERAKKGTKRGITYQRFVSCDVCHGSGSVEHVEPITCPTCGGAGHIRIDFGGLGIFFAMDAITCPECEGAGKVVADPCTSCGGSGRVLSASEVVVDIPADSHDGDEVRKEGMGNAGTNGREPGDFVCRVSVEEERLTRQQESALRMLGLGIPLVVVGLLFAGAGMFSVLMGALFCGMGVAGLVRGGVRGNVRWLRSAFVALGSGLISGGVMCLLFLAMAFNPGFFIVAFLLAMLLLPVVMSRRAR